MFGNKKKFIETTQPVFVNSLNRAIELNSLMESNNQLPMAMLQFITNEVERIKQDQSAFIHIWKYESYPSFNAYEDRRRLSDVIFDIEHKMHWHKDREDRDMIKSNFYPELFNDTAKAKRIEVFAGFEPMHPDDELPGFSYGIKYIHEDETTRVHVFSSSGEGGLSSDSANDRRKRSLNVVTAIAEDILHQVYRQPEDAANVDISIRTDIGIEGFYCPEGWMLKNGPDSKPKKYRSVSIIPPKYYESLIYKNIMQTIISNDKVTVRMYSEEIKTVENTESTYVNREFGVRFFNGDEIINTLVLEETSKVSNELFVRKMNKVIALMDQFYYEFFNMNPSIKMQIEVDFDKTHLLCPTNFEFVDPLITRENQTFKQSC